MENTQKNLTVAINFQYFTSSMFALLNMLHEKSEEIELINKTENFRNKHLKFRKACAELKNIFACGGENNDEIVEKRGMIVKKVYKVITQYLTNLYPEPDVKLFSLLNDKKEKVTIIPGLDIGLVVTLLDEAEMKKLWCNMYTLYICSTTMIHINNTERKNKVLELLPKLKEKAKEYSAEGFMFNPFVGITNDGSNRDDLDVNTMFSGIEQIKQPTSEEAMDNLLKMTGIDKLVDVSKLNEQLKNVSQNDIDDATKNITKLLGAENDEDVNEVCATLVENIVKTLKENPEASIPNMFNIAKQVSNNVSHTLESNKMKKTANQLSHFMKNGEKNLKNLKDDKGNPLGKSVLDSLMLPMQLLQAANKK